MNKSASGGEHLTGPSPVLAEVPAASATTSKTSWSRYLAGAAALSLIALGSIVTIGWIVRIENLIQVLPGMLPMTRNTAACFLLSGVALLVLTLNGPRWLVAACASLVGIVAVLTLLHHLFGIVTGVADILGPPYIPATSTGAGMALITSIAFTVAAIGLLGIPWAPRKRARMVLGITGSIVAACAVAGLTAAGILSGARGLAPHSVAGFLVLGLGMLALGWRSEPDRTPRWLPVAVVIGFLSAVLGLWRTLVDGGHQPFDLVSMVVLAAGTILGLSFGVTVYLAQQGFAQAAVLRRNEAETRQIIDNIPSLISLFAADGHIEYMNRRIFAFTGKSAEELLRWGASDLVHPDDRARSIEASMIGTASAEQYEIVYRMRRHDGAYRWFLAVHTPLRDERGELYRWCVSVTDIDDRKRAEDVLRESERKAQLIVDTIPALVWSATPDGMADFVNQHYQDFVGLPPDQLLGAGWVSCVHKDDVPGLLAVWQAMMDTGQGGEAEARVRRHDGEYRWLMFRTNPIRDGTGTIVRWYGVNSDIEDRKRAVDELRQSEAFLANGQQASHMGSSVWNVRSNTFVLSAEAYRIYEFEPGTQVTLEMLASRVHPDDLHIMEGRLKDVRGGGGYFDYDIRLLMPDGRIKSLRNISQIEHHPERGDEFLTVVQDITERKQAEEELAASKRSLQTTIDTIPALAWSTTADGQADFFNQHYLDFVGLPPEELQGTAWGATVHPDDVPGLISAWQGMVATGQGGHAEARIRRHDGQYRWFLQRANPLRDEAGTIVRWYGINSDIDDSKRAEASLAREKQLLEMIASGRQLRQVLVELCRFVEEDSVDLLCDVHPIDWNTKTFRYGTSPTLPDSYSAPIAGLPVQDDLLPCAVAAHEKVQIIAVDLKTDPRWLASPVREHALKYGLRAVWSTPITSTNGTVLGTLCIYQRRPAEPTVEHQSLIAHATHIASIAIERLQTEEELRRSYDRLAAAQKLSKTGNFTADVVVDHHIWSAELYRIFEFEPGSTISVQNVRDVIHPDDLTGFDTDFGRSAAEGKPFDQVFRIVTKGGALKYLHALAEVAELTQGRPVFSGAIRDVTDERVAEEALSKTRSELAHVARVTALSTLSASIAHEVSQPLAGIVTNASTGLRMLAADPPNIEGARETARRTIRDGNRASEVITRLRALFSSRSQVSDRVDLNEAARHVMALLAGEFQRKRIELVIEPASDLLPVSGDRVQLQQVILNLLMNASDALSAAETGTRRITIKTEMVETDQVRLTVRDTGTGIDPELAGKLFDAFYTTKETGMGIGLSVSRSIIEHHRGRIWASPNEGPGASFSFILPCSETPVLPPLGAVVSDTRQEGAL